MKSTSKENKKKKVIEEIFILCKSKNHFEFTNDTVKEISKKNGFGNPFDATKIDSKEKLPDILLKENYALIHIGNGKHLFVKGIDNVFHDFEPIPEDKIIDWPYQKSLLNQYNTSESNILSVANNQRILHHFLFGKDKEFDDEDVSKRPKTYFPHRTKIDITYYIGQKKIELKNVQMEIDLTIEYQGVIGIFEAKNGVPKSFSIYQLYHPFLYYYNANSAPEICGKIKSIYCVYLVRKKEKDYDALRLWKYTFQNPMKMNSISLIDCKQYNLIKK
ncbi:MAG: hypothetical protein N2203_01315 [Bacteroidia bacterium]|nr:hypothetical protein [Bacteroidia bacterium]